MSEAFHSTRFGKRVWLTNHAIEATAKRSVTLDQVKSLVERRTYLDKQLLAGASDHQLISVCQSERRVRWLPISGMRARY